MISDYFSWLVALAFGFAVVWGVSYVDGDHHECWRIGQSMPIAGDCR